MDNQILLREKCVYCLCREKTHKEDEMHVHKPFMGIAPNGMPISDTYHEDAIEPSKGSYLGRHVRWLYDLHKGSRTKRMIACTLICSELFLSAISVVGIYATYRAVKEYKHCKALADFQRKVATTPLPDIPNVSVKTPLRTMNHVDEYCLDPKSGIIWGKRIGAPITAWKAIYFDGYEESRTPTAISADGKCLSVLDDKGEIHNKKVLKEEWRGEEYHFSDITQEDNWEPTWCTLPWIGRIISLVTGNRLSVPPNRIWTISDRGVFNRCYQDGAGRTVPDTDGSRTLIDLDSKENTLRMFDVWTPKNYFTIISGPDSESFSFLPISFSTAASTTALLGYEKDGNKNGSLCLFTQLSDEDTNGDNPFLKYAYSPKGLPTTGQVLPLESWRKHSLPPVFGRTSFSKEVTIIQTGQGNSARELRLPGTNKYGIKGFFWKNIDEIDWKFEPSALVQTAHPVPIETDKQIPRKVFFWKSKNGKVRLTDFRMESDRSVVEAKMGKLLVPFLLKRRNNLILGPLGWPSHYDLVKPTGISHKKIQKIFGNKDFIPVSVSADKNSLQIASREWVGKKVHWKLKKT